tara:strand:+ start:205 stop:390 length:186 start_codon:yes stop_codon:yes gene_type:complete
MYFCASLRRVNGAEHIMPKMNSAMTKRSILSETSTSCRQPVEGVGDLNAVDIDKSQKKPSH